MKLKVEKVQLQENWSENVNMLIWSYKERSVSVYDVCVAEIVTHAATS